MVFPAQESTIFCFFAACSLCCYCKSMNVSSSIRFLCPVSTYLYFLSTGRQWHFSPSLKSCTHSTCTSLPRTCTLIFVIELHFPFTSVLNLFNKFLQSPFSTFWQDLPYFQPAVPNTLGAVSSCLTASIWVCPSHQDFTFDGGLPC